MTKQLKCFMVVVSWYISKYSFTIKSRFFFPCDFQALKRDFEGIPEEKKHMLLSWKGKTYSSR